jgi:hypothetical protein
VKSLIGRSPYGNTGAAVPGVALLGLVGDALPPLLLLALPARWRGAGTVAVCWTSAVAISSASSLPVLSPAAAASSSSISTTARFMHSRVRPAA